METASDLHKRRKRHFFISCAWFMLFIITLMSFLDFKEGDTPEFIIDLIVIAILAGGLIAIQTTRLDMSIYRITHFLISLNYFYTVSIGAGEGTVLFWVFFLPPLFFFFFGKWEGAVWSLLFTTILGIVMLNPSLFNGHVYDSITKSRFFIALPIVSIICFGLESSRHVFGRMLDEKNRLLLEEKERLEQALNEIKTLGGLIPICAHCKKVRNDQGFWEQVETYIQERSGANFTHGVCPECTELLYSQYLDGPSETGRDTESLGPLSLTSNKLRKTK